MIARWRGTAWLVPAALLIAACARTTDVYVGGAFDAVPVDDGVAGSHAAPPPPAAGTTSMPTATPTADAAGAGGTDSGTAQPSPADAGSIDAAPAPVPACPAGRDDCDADPTNGCEVDLAGDPEHCGACGVACTTPDCACVDGRLGVACPTGRGDCDGDPVNGCEVDLANDEQNCGTCGFVCEASGTGVSSASCQASGCVLVCSAPQLRGDCDGDPANGCETDLYHDPNNCGECGMQCAVCADRVCL